MNQKIKNKDEDIKAMINLLKEADERQGKDDIEFLELEVREKSNEIPVASGSDFLALEALKRNTNFRCKENKFIDKIFKNKQN